MKKQSLVGLKAIDVASTLARDGMFLITSYNKPIALVIPTTFSSKRAFLDMMERVADEVLK